MCHTIVDAAKAALAASSQPNGFKTTLTVDAESSLRTAEAQAIQQMLAEIGVEVEINKIPQADRITALQTGDYEGMIFHEWGADFPDANGMLLPLFHSRNFPAAEQRLVLQQPGRRCIARRGRRGYRATRAMQTLIDAQKKIAADMPIVWLDHFKWFLPMKAGLTGYSIRPALLLGFVPA